VPAPSLDGQVALVTGGGRGIGLAVGEALAAAGAQVALAARSRDQLAKAVGAVEANDGTARAYPLDVTDPGAVTRVVEGVQADLGPVSLLVNNAGTAGHGITVFCVSPGLVRTTMVEESLLGEAGRRWRPQIAAVAPDEYTPAERVATLLVRIATGEADPLSGRFLHADDDLDELLADASPGHRRGPAHPAAAGAGRGLRTDTSPPSGPRG
jgi:NAD(P)-dependent dehydrogenase (short-subunit alcohol dehydrogenase family)